MKNLTAKVVNKFGEEITPAQFVDNYSGVYNGFALETIEEVEAYFTNENFSAMFAEHEELPQAFLDSCCEYYIEQNGLNI